MPEIGQNSEYAHLDVDQVKMLGLNPKSNQCTVCGTSGGKLIYVYKRKNEQFDSFPYAYINNDFDFISFATMELDIAETDNMRMNMLKYHKEAYAEALKEHIKEEAERKKAEIDQVRDEKLATIDIWIAGIKKGEDEDE